jgi:hypothetical protein
MYGLSLSDRHDVCSRHLLVFRCPLTPGIVGMVAYGVAILALERLAILCGVIK